MKCRRERHRLNVSFSMWVTCVHQQQTAGAIYNHTRQNRYTSYLWQPEGHCRIFYGGYQTPCFKAVMIHLSTTVCIKPSCKSSETSHYFCISGWCCWCCTYCGCINISVRMINHIIFPSTIVPSEVSSCVIKYKIILWNKKYVYIFIVNLE